MTETPATAESEKHATLAATDAPIKLERRKDGRLWLSHSGKERAVKVRPCFPWTLPGQYLSLRDDEDKEVLLIDGLDGLDAQSQPLIREALGESAFVFEVQEVLSITEEFELRAWEVRTRQGTRRFQTKKDTWPLEVASGGMLVKDVAGDIFHIPDIDKLDSRSRDIVEPFVD